MAEAEDTAVRARLETDRRDLLDFSLRNPLLNYRPRAGAWRWSAKSPEQVFQVLRARGAAHGLPAARRGRRRPGRSGCPRNRRRATGSRPPRPIGSCKRASPRTSCSRGCWRSSTRRGRRSRSRGSTRSSSRSGCSAGSRTMPSARSPARAADPGPGRAGAVERARAVPAPLVGERPGVQPLAGREAAGRVRGRVPRAARGRRAGRRRATSTTWPRPSRGRPRWAVERDGGRARVLLVRQVPDVPRPRRGDAGPTDARPGEHPIVRALLHRRLPRAGARGRRGRSARPRSRCRRDSAWSSTPTARRRWPSST